jgi:hypothetical protein
VQALGVALGFVGNYAPCGLSPQTDGMPVVQTQAAVINMRITAALFSKIGNSIETEALCFACFRCGIIFLIRLHMLFIVQQERYQLNDERYHP